MLESEKNNWHVSFEFHILICFVHILELYFALNLNELEN